MRQLMIKPTIFKYNKCKEFCKEFEVGEGDLIITNEAIYNPYFADLNLKANVIFQEAYGLGEPSDEMVEKIYKDVKDLDYKRVIAIGGGTIIDISKLFALKNLMPILDLFDKKLKIIKDKELILLPTTCGTGSEVTNISILELKSRKTKLGLAVDELYADSAVMVPELIKGLPFKFFGTSSIDALIHAVESYVSPKATPYTDIFAVAAMEKLINGFKIIAENGQEARLDLLEDFLIASNYAGISFGNAGVGAVHAMSYPLGATYHVAHGESNYVIFTEVFKRYVRLKPEGKIVELNNLLAELLECDVEVVYDKLETLLNNIIPKKPLSVYGTTMDDLKAFTENVMTKQQRLTANNYTDLDESEVYDIYKTLL